MSVPGNNNERVGTDHVDNDHMHVDNPHFDNRHVDNNHTGDEPASAEGTDTRSFVRKTASQTVNMLGELGRCVSKLGEIIFTTQRDLAGNMALTLALAKNVQELEAKVKKQDEFLSALATMPEIVNNPKVATQYIQEMAAKALEGSGTEAGSA